MTSGLSDNASLGLPAPDGPMLVSRRNTTQLGFIPLDECRLTGVRTAAAGAVVGAPSRVERSGVFSGGVHGKMQVEALLPIVECRLCPRLRANGSKEFRRHVTGY